MSMHWSTTSLVFSQCRKCCSCSRTSASTRDEEVVEGATRAPFLGARGPSRRDRSDDAKWRPSGQKLCRVWYCLVRTLTVTLQCSRASGRRNEPERGTAPPPRWRTTRIAPGSAHDRPSLHALDGHPVHLPDVHRTVDRPPGRSFLPRSRERPSGQVDHRGRHPGPSG